MSDHEINEEGLTRREALKRGAILGGVALAWTTPAVQIVGMSPALAQSTSPGVAGCTPGFWKNSEFSWVGYLPGDYLQDVFGPCAPQATFLEALDFGGSDGMLYILSRAAVAALLNASHPDVSYSMTAAYVISEYQGVCGGSDAEMEAVKNVFDSANNAGCPLSNDSSFNKPPRPGRDD